MIYVNKLYGLNETRVLHLNKFSIKADEVIERLFVIDDIITDEIKNEFVGRNFIVMNVAQLEGFKNKLTGLIKEIAEYEKIDHLKWVIDKLNEIIMEDGYDNTSNYCVGYSIEIIS